MPDKTDEKQQDPTNSAEGSAASSPHLRSDDGVPEKNQPFDGDETDEDLMALSPPPPSPRFLVFTGAVLVLSVTMLFWFTPELKFFLSQFTGPVALGEAADIDLSKLSSGQYATVKGLPMVQRTLTFKEGVKWFMLSDNTRKFFPLAGRPNFYVQWTETDAHKAYRDPESNPGVVGPPSEFKGHLVSRESLGNNYDAVFVFYDCLKYHYLGRCNRCLGQTSQDVCRDTFVCAENNDPELCSELLTQSEKRIKDELDALRQSGDKNERIQSLEAMQNAQREHRVSIQSVKLEEMVQLAARLRRLAEKSGSELRSKLEKVYDSLFSLRLEELTVRAANAYRTLGALSVTQREDVKTAVKALEERRAEKARITDELKIMRIFINIGDELERLKKRTLTIRKKAAFIPIEKLKTLAAFNPDTREGNEIIDAVGRLETSIAEIERAIWRKNLGDGGMPAEIVDGGAVDGIATIPLPPVSAELAANPDYIKLLENLDGVVARVDAALSKLKVLMPGQNKQFDEWAVKPDVLGTIPEGLREVRVIGALAKLEQLLNELPSSDDADKPSLAEVYNENIDELERASSEVNALEKKPGLNEYILTDRISRLKSGKSGDDGETSRQRRMESLLADLSAAGLYLFKLKGAPDEMAKLEKLLSSERLDPLEASMKSMEESLTNGDWVLVDGEIPLDKIWVVVVYLVLLFMIFVNLRKIWRFFLAYKE